MPLKLFIKKELTPLKFSEIGRPYRIFRDENRGLLAVCSHIPTPMHGSKWYHGPGILEHRVSLYQLPDMVRLGVFLCRFQINHVSFHETKSILLVSTGSYDGGYSYHGDLLCFDWDKRTGRKMLGESREAVAARYRDDGRINVLLRPRDEEEFVNAETEEYPNHDRICVGLVIDDHGVADWPNENKQWLQDGRLEGLVPCNPVDFGFKTDELNQPYFHAAKPTADELRQLSEAGYRERAGVWGLHSLGQGRFAVLMNGRIIEIWHKENGLESCSKGECDGLEFLHETKGDLLFHVLVRGKPRTVEPTFSQLWKISQGEVSLWKAFDGGYSWCVNRNGWLLGLEQWNGHLKRRSLRISPTGDIFPGPEECCGDRYGRLQLFPREACELHFIRRSGEWRDFDYRLWLLKETGVEVEVGPLGSPGVSDSVEYAIRWDETHHVRVCDRLEIAKHPRVPCSPQLELIESGTGKVEFSIPLRGSVTQLIRLHDTDAVVIGFTDGALSVVDVKMRKIVIVEMLMVDGLICVPSSLAEIEGEIIIGTDDGRLIVTSLVESDFAQCYTRNTSP